jgi:hypothetical protein
MKEPFPTVGWFLLALCIGWFLCLVAAHAQQQPQFLPLTEWRAAIDVDLAKVSMPRDGHAAIYNILQAYERQAQAAKMQQSQDAQGQRHLSPPQIEERK